MDVDFAAVAAALRHPLVLAGFALFVVAGLFHAALKSDRIPVVDKRTAGRLVLRLPLYVFVLALLLVVGGLALAFVQASRTTVDAGAIVEQFASLREEKAALAGELAAKDRHLDDLRATIVALTSEARQPDAPPGLEAALERVAAGGDPAELTALLTDVAERAEAGLAAAEAQAAEERAAALRAWREAATLAWWTETGAALDAYRRITALDPDDAAAWLNRGGLAMRAGDLAEAEVAFTAGAAAAERTGDEGSAADAAVFAGDLARARGDLDLALSRYEDAQKRNAALAEADPGNAGWQRDLSVSQERIGDVRREQGDLAGALAAYEQSLAIRQDLAEADPGNAGWQRDLSVSLNKIGDVRREQGDLAGALAAYEQSLAIAEDLAEADPGNAGWQRDLIVSHWKLATVAGEEAKAAEAAAAYREALAIASAMQSAGTLAPRDAWIPDELRRRIAALQGD